MVPRGELLRLVPVLAFGAAAGTWTALAHGPCPANDAHALADALGAATEGVVDAADLRWEPSRGALSDLVLGRFALVLSRPRPGAPRDVWRVRVHVTPEGHPLATGDAHDLTQSPDGDDHALVVHGDHAAFATFLYGQEQSVTTLDLGGEGPQSFARTTLDEATGALTNLQQTGTFAGIGRIDVNFDAPGDRVGLALDDGSLAIDLGDATGQRRVTLDLAHAEVTPSTAVHAEPARHLPKRFVFWAVDTVRAVSWIGPAPVAWLEEKVFAARDKLRQATYHADGAESQLAETPPRVLNATAQADETTWPPANVASIWKAPEAGEGAWKPYAPAWMRKTDGAPPAFFTTFVRPDEARPYSHVLLVAMDMRQLDLDMEAGTEDPKPLTGQHGPGRLPRDPAVLTRVVAAFNGAFKTEHGTYGMMVHKRVLLPAQPNAATVLVLRDGRAGFGTWGPSAAMGLAGVREDDVMSFRQNLDPLLDGGEVNPTRRQLWGYTLPGSGMQTERSGLCVTFSHHLVYAWGDDVSATTLGKAMRSAGCDYGMHLDMNPHHTGFLFTTIHEIKGHAYRSEALTPLMEMSTDRYIEYAAKDFFYVTLRDPSPARLEGASAWVADPGVQPAPSWSPGVWATKLGEVSLVSIDAGRARYRMTAGTDEPNVKGAFELVESAPVLLSMSLGVAGKHPRGLTIGGKHLVETSHGEDLAVLLQHDGVLAITTADDPVLAKPGVDASVLPLLLRDGAFTGRADMSLVRKAGALGVCAGGRVVVARGDVTTPKPLAAALKAAGCPTAVLLDRGEEATAEVRRGGTDNPPLARSNTTTLYALGLLLEPRSFHARSEADQAAR